MTFKILNTFDTALIGRFTIVAAKVPPTTISSELKFINQYILPPPAIMPTVTIPTPANRPINVPKSVVPSFFFITYPTSKINL